MNYIRRTAGTVTLILCEFRANLRLFQCFLSFNSGKRRIFHFVV